VEYGEETVVIWAAISCYSACNASTLIGLITASDYAYILGKQVHLVVQMILKMMQFSKKTIRPYTQPEEFNLGLRSITIHLNSSPGTEESPDLNIIKPLWSVLESRVRSRVPPPLPLKQLGAFLHEIY
jgi:hypothetical protein